MGLRDMKVLLIPSWFPPALEQLGGSFIQEQAISLAAEGIDIAVIIVRSTFNPLDRIKKIEDRIKFSDRNGVKTYEVTAFLGPKRIPFFYNWWKEEYKKAYKTIFFNEDKPDLIHAHGYVGGFFARELNKTFGIDYIITEHNSSLLYKGAPKQYFNRLTSTYNDAKKVLAVGPQLKDTLRLLSDVDVALIDNGVLADRFKIIKTKPKHPFVFCNLGSLIPRKNQLLLLEEFASLVSANPRIEFRLRIVGNGPLENKLRSEAKKLAVSDKVEFLGSKPRNEVRSLIASSHCLVSTSHIETFGITLVEALFCGIPVISSKTGIAEEVINKSNGLVFDLGDKNDLHRAMFSLYNHYDRFEPDYIRKEAVMRFDQKVISGKLAKIYSDILTSEYAK